MRYAFHLVVCASITVAGAADLPPEFVKTHGLQLCDHAGTGRPLTLHGTNLGGWLMFESWMAPCGQAAAGEAGMRLQNEVDAILTKRFGVATKNRLLDAYQDAWITGIDLDRIADMGMNLVRVPFTYHALYETQGPEVPLASLAWRSEAEAFKRLDWIVAEAGKRGIYVLLDLHQVEGTGAQGTPKSPDSFWARKVYQERAVEVWRRVARRYAGNPMVIGYDLLNEPYGVPMDFYDACYKAIRAVDPDHTIFLETWRYDRMPKGNSEYGWTNVVCSLHLYNKGRDDVQATLDQALKPLETARGFSNPANQVPIHVGEFFVMGDDDALWATMTKAFGEAEIPWNSWTYKTMNQRAWCLVNGADAPAGPRVPDIERDGADAIAAAWSAWRTVPELAVHAETRNRLAGPVPVDDALTTGADGRVRFTIDGLLANDRTLSSKAELGMMELGARTAHGTISGDDNGYTYAADAGFSGTDRFEYQVVDIRSGIAAVRPGVVTITVRRK